MRSILTSCSFVCARFFACDTVECSQVHGDNILGDIEGLGGKLLKEA